MPNKRRMRRSSECVLFSGSSQDLPSSHLPPYSDISRYFDHLRNTLSGEDKINLVNFTCKYLKQIWILMADKSTKNKLRTFHEKVISYNSNSLSC